MKLSSLFTFGALFLIAVACSDSTVAENNVESGDRYILRSSDVGAGEREAQGRGLSVERRMKFERAIVVRGSESKVAAAAKSLGGSYERDLVYSLPEIYGRGAGGGGITQPPQSVPWGVTKVRASQASSRGQGVVVCISDTGIDTSHPDLVANILSTFNTINSSKLGTDDNGHGTHVAGTIAAVDNAIGVVGIAPEAKLIAGKGLNRNGSGFSSDLAETIDECRVRGAHVINMSWGSAFPSQVIHDALIRASDAGVLLIAAAGNEAGAVSYPAAFAEVVAVSAVDVNDAFASFSNFGVDVENSAPGVNIPSTWMGSSYRTISGTSMATPHVVGVAALMLSALPGSGRSHLLGVDIGLSLDRQGSRGRIDAVLSTSP